MSQLALRQALSIGLAVSLLGGSLASGESAQAASGGTELQDVQLEVAHTDRLATKDVRVTGRAIFRGLPEVIATDPAGDARVRNIGADLVAASISRPDRHGDELEFTLEVADPPPSPAQGGVPEVVTYTFMFYRPGVMFFRLEASASSQYHEPGVDPVGVLVKCQFTGTTAGLQCPIIGWPLGLPEVDDDVHEVAPTLERVPVEIADGVIRFRPTLSQLGLQPGEAFRVENPTTPDGGVVPAMTSAAGVPSATYYADTAGGPHRIDAMSPTNFSHLYRVPVERIRVAWGPPDDTPDDILSSHRAIDVEAEPSGAFATVLQGLPTGASHRVVVAACYGGNSCATWSEVVDLAAADADAEEDADAPDAPDPADVEAADDPSLPDPGVVRHGGADRFDTAAMVSAASFAPGVEAVYVATGSDFADALTGAVAAAVDGAPVLLVTHDGIPQRTAAELERLQPGRVLILGGRGAVSESVEQALADYTVGPVERLWGSDRFATAAAVSQGAFPSGADLVYVATGSDFPDALTGVPAAASASGPLLLVTADQVPDTTAAELDRLAPARIVVLGGPAVVSQGVVGALTAHAATVDRVWGADRFATAGAIAAAAFPDPEAVHTVFVATGAAFPDALAAGAVAGAAPAPVLLSAPTSLPDATIAQLERLGPRRIAVMGGAAAIDAAVENQLAGYVTD